MRFRAKASFACALSVFFVRQEKLLFCMQILAIIIKIKKGLKAIVIFAECVYYTLYYRKRGRVKTGSFSCCYCTACKFFSR